MSDSYSVGNWIAEGEANHASANFWADHDDEDVALREFKEAIKCFDKAFELDPKEVNALNFKAVTLADFGEFKEAIKCLDKAIEVEPNNTYLWNSKGNIWARSENNNAAMECFDKSLELHPNHTVAWISKGSLLGKMGKHEEAIKCFEKAAELDPKMLDDIKSSLSLMIPAMTDDVYGCKTWTEIKLKIERMIPAGTKEKTTRIPEAVFQEGDDLVNSGKHKEAIKCYDKAIEMDPKNARAWYNKGEVLSSTTSARGLFINNQDRYDAIDCFKKVIELDPRNAAKAWVNIAKVLAGLNIKKNSNDIIMCCDAALDNQGTEISGTRPGNQV